MSRSFLLCCWLAARDPAAKSARRPGLDAGRMPDLTLWPEGADLRASPGAMMTARATGPISAR